MVAPHFQALGHGGFIDCHCHLLPGIDDGPADEGESLEMAAVLGSFGFSRLFCTPHLIQGAYDNRPDRIRAETLRLQEALERHELPVSVHAAGEYYLDEYLQTALGRPLTLWENVILLEAHRYVRPGLLAESAYQIITVSKLRPLIAHPERYEFLAPKTRSRSGGVLSLFRAGRGAAAWNSPERDAGETDIFLKLRDMGCLFQGNIGSFAGIYGDHIRKRSIQLLRRGVYDHIATDAHRAHGLAEWLKNGLAVVEQEAGIEVLAKLLRLPVTAAGPS